MFDDNMPQSSVMTFPPSPWKVVRGWAAFKGAKGDSQSLISGWQHFCPLLANTLSLGGMDHQPLGHSFDGREKRCISDGIEENLTLGEKSIENI